MSVLPFERLPDDEKRLASLLRERNLIRFAISDPICFRSIDSTQAFVANELKSSKEGDMVMSLVQTAGRGREGRYWYSQGGGLWMTLTLVPPVPEIVAAVSRIATDSIVNALAKYGLPHCSVKPPNDVFFGKRKIAGVLVDASVKGDSSLAYLGVGININNEPTSISEISDLATSLWLETSRITNLIEFAATFIECLDLEYWLEIEHCSASSSR